MDRESKALTLAGAILGLLALSATAAAGLRPPARSPVPPEVSVSAAAAETEEAVPVLATEPSVQFSPDAGPYYVSVRVTEPVWGERLFVCDGMGCPLEELLPDRDGDAELGPLAPGRYGLWQGQTRIGSFLLADNAALPEAQGRLWTDGELLHLERFVPGTARFTLRLPKPGYYGLLLWDRFGRRSARDLYLPENAEPDPEGGYLRVLEFPGLAPGLYTLARNGTVLAQVEVEAGQTALAELRIEN